MKRAHAGLAWMIALGAAAGCTGNIGDPGGGAGSRPGAGEPPGKMPVAKLPADPGRVTLHRLNRAEYDNTVRDLLGTKLTPALDFPNDDHSYGFDNIADVLTVSPLQLELYEQAAEKLAAEATATAVLPQSTQVEAETLMGSVGVVSQNAWLLYSDGDVGTPFTFPADGHYQVSTRVWGDQVPPDPVEMTIHVGAQVFGPLPVVSVAAAPQVVVQDVIVKAGKQVVSVEFLNDFYDQAKGLDRNLYVDWIKVEGPLGLPTSNPIRDRLLHGCDPLKDAACTRRVIGELATRAFRRPVDKAELDELAAFLDLARAEGEDGNRGLELAITAVLLSPEFLFRVELDADPAGAAAHPLGDYELASRLSYFLWSTMPDDALFAAAKAGTLHDPKELAAQVRRMLADARADALTDNFAGQWLFTRALADHNPDYATYPEFDEPLRQAMAGEANLFFKEFLRGDLGVDQMLSTDFTFLNDRLATHYGLPAVGGAALRRVKLPSDRRGGLLKQAGLLMVTSQPTRTSPVKRGKWILGNLLCAEPPPPPPNIPPIPIQKKPTGSFRQRLEEHIKNPVCASCHETMDPIGFALDHYDGVGAWRDLDQGFAIDAKGVLPGGVTFDGAAEMAKVLAGDARLGPCVASKMFTYALGRGPDAADQPYLDTIAASFKGGGYKLSDLAVLVATSDPFRLRRGEPKGGHP